MEQMTRTVTLIGKNELRYCERYSGLECDADHMLIATYLRDGSKELEQSAEYQYLNEVTVSTVQELIEAIQNRTKIILKEGVYNFSEVDCDSIDLERKPDPAWGGSVCKDRAMGQRRGGVLRLSGGGRGS